MTTISGNSRHDTFLIVRCSTVGVMSFSLRGVTCLLPDCSAHQARALVVESPAGDQVLHGLGVIAGAERVLLVEAMRRLDLRHVDLHPETGPIRNGDQAALDLQRLPGQALAVLPDPVRV